MTLQTAPQYKNSGNGVEDGIGSFQLGSGLATYSAEIQGITPYATPTDLFTIFGAPGKVTRISGMRLFGRSTAAAVVILNWSKRSAINTGGTFVAMTAVPYDSASPAAGATVGYYTAAPSGLGAAVGNLRITSTVTTVIVASGGQNSLITGSFPPANLITFNSPILLRGATEGVAINLAGVANPSGYIVDMGAEWTESAN